MAKSQLSNKKEWYKHGWGLLVAILFFPYFLIWYAWAKSGWSKNLKIGLTAAVAVVMLPVMIGAAAAKPAKTNNQQNSSVSQKQSDSEKQQALQAEEATRTASRKETQEKAVAEAAAQKKAAEDAATTAAAKRSAESTATSAAPSTQPAAPAAEPSSNLPLKAICNDGTTSYQDSPSKPDYRGMCSGHDGIKTKLGRTP